MLKVPRQGSRIFKFRSRGCRDLVSSLREARPAEETGATTGSSGSIASGSGTENTTFASALPTRRRTAKSGKDWSIGFAKCITSASGAGGAKDHKRTLDQDRPLRTTRRGLSRLVYLGQPILCGGGTECRHWTR